MRASLRIEAKRPGYACAHSVRALRRMIEAAGAHRCFVAEPCVHLIRHCKGYQKILAARIRIFCRGENWREIIARMASLTFGEIAVIEIEIPDDGAIEKGSAIRRRFGIGADQRA